MGLHNIQHTLANGEFEQSGNIIYIPGKGNLFGWGTALPVTTIWAKGAIFIKIDGADDETLYINEEDAGEGTAPSWVAQVT